MADTRKRRIVAAFGGAVAQLGERLVRNEEVRGSTPLGSTSAARPKLDFSNIASVTTLSTGSEESRSWSARQFRFPCYLRAVNPMTADMPLWRMPSCISTSSSTIVTP